MRAAKHLGKQSVPSGYYYEWKNCSAPSSEPMCFPQVCEPQIVTSEQSQTPWWGRHCPEKQLCMCAGSVGAPCVTWKHGCVMCTRMEGYKCACTTCARVSVRHMGLFWQHWVGSAAHGKCGVSACSVRAHTWHAACTEV